MAGMAVLMAFLAGINGLAFYQMGRDKMSAINSGGRTPEALFVLLTVLGGGPGILAGMLIFRHKTLHLKFTVGVPLMMILETAAVLGIRHIRRRGHHVFTAVLLAIFLLNLIWFLLVGWDKRRSQKRRSQIPNSVFWFWGLAGCAPGIFFGTRYFHHKTTRLQYRIWMLLAAVLQFCFILFLAARYFF